jgi:3',5'-cyclic AMP phosphodiesterase CpdA
VLIAQVSDPHLALGPVARGDYDPEAALAATLGRVAAIDPRPDVLLLTGDLAEHGTADEYAKVAALCSAVDLPMAAIPGNHDRRAPFVAGLAGGGIAIGAEPFLHLVLDRWPVRLIGLDTLHEGSNGGLLCEERLAWIAARLAEDDRPTLVFMHHQPFTTGIRFSDTGVCVNGDRLGDLVRAHGNVLKVTCGHLHRAVDTAWAGTVAGICPGVAWQVPLDLSPEGRPRLVPQRPGFQLHLWTPGRGLVTHTEYLA